MNFLKESLDNNRGSNRHVRRGLMHSGKHISSCTGPWSEITMLLYWLSLTIGRILLSTRKKSILEKEWWTGEKKEYCLSVGLFLLQGSESAYVSINDWITAPEFEILLLGLGFDLSSFGCKTLLKSPPSINWLLLRSGNTAIKSVKKSGLSQLGPYTLANVIWVPYNLPVTITYLPLESHTVCDGVNGMPFLIKIAVPRTLSSFFEQNNCPIQALFSFEHSLDRKWVSCRNMTSLPNVFICANTLLRFTGLWIPLMFQLKKRIWPNLSVSDIVLLG